MSVRCYAVAELPRTTLWRKRYCIVSRIVSQYVATYITTCVVIIVITTVITTYAPLENIGRNNL